MVSWWSKKCTQNVASEVVTPSAIPASDLKRIVSVLKLPNWEWGKIA